MKCSEVRYIARQAEEARAKGKVTIELDVHDDPRVAQSLSAEDVASCLYPLCKGGPMGMIVSVDHRSQTGTIRLRFNVAALLKWAQGQGVSC